MNRLTLHALFRAIYPQRDSAEIKKKYHIPDSVHVTVKLTPEGWLTATSPELPGLVTQAASREELIEMVNDAVLTYFDVPKRYADIVYNQLKIGGETIQYQGELATRPA